LAASTHLLIAGIFHNYITCGNIFSTVCTNTLNKILYEYVKNKLLARNAFVYKWICLG